MDIGSLNYGFRAIKLSDTRFSFPAHIGFKVIEDLTVKLDLNYLMIGGADSPDRGRTLKFTTHGIEPILRVDYNIVGGEKPLGSSIIFNRRGMVNNYGSSFIYVFAGGGGILTKAKVKTFDGVEVIGNTAYSNNLHWGFVLPAGIGYKRSINAYFDFAIEVGGRLTLTDKIDGYQHPASQYNDRYITTSFKAIYKIANDRKGRPILFDYGRR
jgi:hypothetical protein